MSSILQVQEARDFYRFVLALGRHKSSLLHPEVSSDQGDGVGEGRAGLVIPRRGARRHATLLTDQDIRCQRHHADLVSTGQRAQHRCLGPS